MTLRLFFLAFVGSLAFSSLSVWSDEVVVPGNGFVASHYETLWTKSPFTVASAEGPAESPDYLLYGVAQLDGVSYASLLDKQNQEHFLVASNKPVRGVTLVSVTHGHDSSSTFAVIQKGGQSITLKLEQASAGIATPNMAANGPVTSPLINRFQAPGIGGPNAGQMINPNRFQPQNPGGTNTGVTYPPGMGQPPQPMFRPRTIHVPPPPPPQ